MKDIFWLMKKILKVTFSKKRNIVIYFGVPLIGILISFFVYGNPGSQVLKVGVVNQDRHVIANDTVRFLANLQNVNVEKINNSTVNEKISNGALDCVIILNKGFSERIISGKPANIQIVAIKGEEVTGFVKSYLYQYLDNIILIGKASSGDTNIFEKMYTNYQQDHFKLSTESLKDTSKGKKMTYQTLGFLIMIMLMSAGNFSEIIIKEKENRTYFRLLSSPISARKYLLSNIAVSLLVMVAQILCTLFFITFIFHIDMNVPFWQMTAVLVLFAVVAIGLSLMLVSFAGSSASINALQNLVSTPTCLLAGCFWPVEIMPKAVQKLADFLPQRWTLDTISKIQHGNHFNTLYLNYLILAVFAVAFFLIAVYKFGKSNSVKNFV
jgi:ABC-2 type transport system permease protein